MANEDLGRLKIEKTSLPGGRRKRFPGWAVAAAVVVVIIAGLYFTGALAPAVEVETTTVSLVYPSQTFTRLNASGYVVAQRKAAVAAKVTGRLVWLGVKEGDRVKAGQVIARLENEDVTAVKAQAKAGLSQSRALFEKAASDISSARAQLGQADAELVDSGLNADRMSELYKRGIVSKSDLDSAQARYRKAVAAVAGAKSLIKSAEAAKSAAKDAEAAAGALLKGADVAIGYTQITAPFDAVVLTKNADIGDIVTPIGAAANAKAAVVSIADMGSLEIEADVSESNLSQVKAGQPCEIQLDALPGERFKGEVATVVPTADRTKASIMVKVRFIDNDARILPEMSAKVAFLERAVGQGDDKPRLAVSPAALGKKGGRDVVYIIKDGTAAETPVTVGPKLGDWVEVSGIKAGEKVAVTHTGRLKNGVKVKEPAK